MIAVDTHVLIWDALLPARLSQQAIQTIAEANQTDGLVVADISLWEMAMLIQKGRIRVATDTHAFLNLILTANKITVRAITPQIASLSAQLPAVLEADPADRLIVATALAEGAPLVTADRKLRRSDEIETIW